MRINVAGIASEESVVLLPEGERHVRILKATAKQSQKGKDMIQLILQPMDPAHALCNDIFHYMMFPERIDELATEEEKAKFEKMNRFRRLDLKVLLEETKIDYDDQGFEVEDLEGKELTILVEHENGDRGQQARVKRIITNS